MRNDEGRYVPAPEPKETEHKCEKCGSAMLLATTMTTTFWLEDRAVGAILRWEWLRLVFGIGIAFWAATSGAGVGLVVIAAIYLVANLWFLAQLPRQGSAVAEAV